MTTKLKRGANAGVTLFSSGNIIPEYKPKISYGKSTKSESIVLHVTDIPVFRSGTFRDSYGFQHTWEDVHVDQMVANFDYLLRQGIFEDVPVRKGHGSLFGEPMDGLIGWHTGLKAEVHTAKDGKEYNFLLASFEIFDADAQPHIEEGHWRNRSSEVGFYLTNTEAEFWPVYQGFAYVDIPAVEFLNSFSKSRGPEFDEYTVMTEEEIADMTRPSKNNHSQPDTAGAAGGDAADAPETPPANDPAPETSPETPPANDPAPAPETPPANDPAPEAPVAEGGTVQHGQQQQTHSFRINGQSVSDFAAVQSHIDTLESAQREHVQNHRANFVKGLAKANKIPATQIEALTSHAQGLTADQFNAWSASYESVPASPLFGQYGASGGDGSGQPSDTSEAADEISTLRGVVEMHSQTMTKEQLEKTSSFKRLQELTAAAAGNQS